MEHKAVNFIIQGMQRDLNVARYDQNFAYENMNIRLTAMDNKTLLAVTNERGNKKLLVEDEDTKQNITILGNYVGHCIVGKYLILFTTNSTNDYIYRLYFENENLIGKILNSKKLNFSEEHPIEALGIYEAEDIQKVYWVDGINPIRYINIANNKYDYSNNDSVYDFTGEVPFPLEFKVIKLNSSSGQFLSGIIQYAYSFYDKNGRESNIIDVSSLNYITNSNRGADAETVCNNSFEIKIEGIDNSNFKYDYLRIYSIHRTSIDAIPSCKIVTDIKLEPSNQDIIYVDTGITGSIIDPYELLYKGGESIIPKTIAAKDGTLFLGNYSTKSNIVDNTIKEEVKILTVKFNDKNSELITESSGFYDYKFQLNNTSKEISTFKQGETYRFGIQLQDKRGKWSEVIYVGDYEIPYSIATENNTIKLPKPYIEINDSLKKKLNEFGYIKIRGNVVYPNNSDRTIVAQGIVCPTVFNLNNRVTGNTFAQSSWFARPFAPIDMDSSDNIVENRYNNSTGTALEFRHEYLVPIDNLQYNMEIGVSPFKKPNKAPKNPWVGIMDENYNQIVVDNKYENSLYYVDHSILTFHSPEFIFSEEYNNIDNLDLKMKIVGFVPLTSFISDISITTQSAGLFNDKIKDYTKIGVKGKSEYGYRSLSSGLFYDDAMYSKDDTEGKSRASYLILPWHRNGSLNDSPKVSADKTRTAILKRKVMSNLKFSYNSIYIEKSKQWKAYIENDINKTGITSVRMFNSNELSIVKIPQPKNSNIGDITYMGNIDTIATGNNIIYGSHTTSDNLLSTLIQLENDDITNAKGEKILSSDPVSIKYKSTPHLVFGFNYTTKGQQNILPSLNGLNSTKNRSSLPAWSTGSENWYLKLLDSKDVSKNYKELYSVDREVNSISFKELNALDDPSEIWIYDNTVNKFFICKELNQNHNTITWHEKVIQGVEYFKCISSYTHDYYYYVWTIREYFIDDKDNILPPDNIDIDTEYGGLYLVELYKDVVNRFGGNTEQDIQNNLWYPAGESVSIDNSIVEFTEGDTFYQRFDCLKTYPYTQEDQNSIVEIVSFMCETHINIDGRHDRNRGQHNNLNMTPTNFNLYNPVYNQRNNFFNYRILSEDFNNTKFPTTITWTLNKTLGERIDSWTKINLTSLLDLDGNNGELQKLEVLNNEIYSFQDNAIAKILFNSRVQIPTSEGVPIEIANSGKVDGKVYLTQEVGTINKWSVLTTPNGTYFIDNKNFGIYLLSQGIKCISDMLNMSSVIKENSSTKEWNPKDFDNFRCFYDRINSDVYFVNKDICLCYNELLGQFTSYYSYENTPMMININDKFISYKINYIWEFFKGDYNSFYDNIKPFYITWIANPEPMKDKIFNNLDFRSDTYSNDTLLNRTFDTLEVWNEYQRGKSKLTNVIGRPSSLKKKFRIWRAQIPRHNNSLQRIRNPWCYIKLSMDNPSNYKTIFYDATLTYSV